MLQIAAKYKSKNIFHKTPKSVCTHRAQPPVHTGSQKKIVGQIWTNSNIGLKM